MSLSTISISQSEWFNLISTLAGVIVGGVISAAVSIWSSRHAAKHASALAKEDRVAIERLASFRLMSKLMKVANDVDFLLRHFQRGLDGDQNIPDMWSRIVPAMGFSADLLSVEADELAIFLSEREYAYAEKLLYASDEYNSLIMGFGEYCRRRDLLTEQISILEGGVMSISNQQVISGIRQDELNPLLPTMNALSGCISDIVERMPALMRVLNQLARDFGPILQKRFADKEFPSLELNVSNP